MFGFHHIYFYGCLLSVVGNDGGPLQASLGNSNSQAGGRQVREDWKACVSSHTYESSADQSGGSILMPTHPAEETYVTHVPNHLHSWRRTEVVYFSNDMHSTCVI